MHEAIASILLFWTISDQTMPQPSNHHYRLIDNLGHVNWKEREKSAAALQALGRQAVLSVERYGVYHHNPEVSRRSQQILDRFFLLPEDGGNLPICALLRKREFTFKSGRTLNLPKGTAHAWFLVAPGEDTITDWNIYRPNEHKMADATNMFFYNLLRIGYSKEDLNEIVQYMKDNAHRFSIYNFNSDEDDLTDDNPDTCYPYGCGGRGGR